MGKKYSEIAQEINESGEGFLSFLNKNLDAEVWGFLNSLAKKTDLFVFSGVIRDYFLGNNDLRDIDIVLNEKVEIEMFADDSVSISKNSFGGYKLDFKGFNIDLWFLRDTWAIKYQPKFDFTELDKMIPATAFFNFSAIVYSLNKKTFYFTVDFVRFLRKKEIDVVYKPNLNYKLCIINTLYYSDKNNLIVSDNLQNYLRHLHLSGDKLYNRTQTKHFGKVIYSDETVNHRILNMREKSTRKAFSNNQTKLFE